jgi:hypothetical protein
VFNTLGLYDWGLYVNKFYANFATKKLTTRIKGKIVILGVIGAVIFNYFMTFFFYLAKKIFYMLGILFYFISQILIGGEELVNGVRNYRGIIVSLIGVKLNEIVEI